MRIAYGVLFRVLVAFFASGHACDALAADFAAATAAERAKWAEQVDALLRPTRDLAGHEPIGGPAGSEVQSSVALGKVVEPPPISGPRSGRWQTDESGFVVFADGQRLMGSRVFVRSCFLQYGNSFLRWAKAYSQRLRVAHLVATAITETGCSAQAGLSSVDGKSTGLMQVTGPTCRELMERVARQSIREADCLERMAADPDFSIQLAAAYISRPEQVSLTGLDPPRVAAAYNAGGVYADPGNPWRLRSTGNHIDRFIAAYNAFISWQIDERAGRKTRSPAVQLGASAALPRAVSSVQELDALSSRAQAGAVVFVVDVTAGRGDYYVFVGGRWLASTEDSERS